MSELTKQAAEAARILINMVASYDPGLSADMPRTVETTVRRLHKAGLLPAGSDEDGNPVVSLGPLVTAVFLLLESSALEMQLQGDSSRAEVLIEMRRWATEFAD